MAAFAAPSGTATEYVKEEIMSMTLMDELGEEGTGHCARSLVHKSA